MKKLMKCFTSGSKDAKTPKRLFVQRCLFLVLLVLSPVLCPPPTRAEGIKSTKHNLSLTGPGPIKAVSETEICVFCHTPHNGNPSQPLWNHQINASQSYTLYTSESLTVVAAQPNGYSRLCLSCHDGTLAIGAVQMLRGQVATGTIAMQGVEAGGQMPATTGARLGTDLTNDHPISFLFDSSVATVDEELVDPSTLTGIIRLYPRNDSGIRDSVQCTSCHDPHNAGLPKFVKKSPFGTSDTLCMTCHTKRDWGNSIHQVSTLVPLATGVSVATNSCMNCHHPHNEGPPRLLRSSSPVGTPPGVEQTCYRCHNADQPGTIPNIQSEFAKTYRMPIDSRTGHYITNSNFFEDQSNLNSNRHVECTDCHNPHRVIKNTQHDGGGSSAQRTHDHSAPHSNIASGALKGMWGVEPTFGSAWTQPTSFTELKNWPNLVTREYQVCLKCHSYYGFGNNPPTNFTSVGINGVTQLTDQALELNPANRSFHPVIQQTGRTLAIRGITGSSPWLLPWKNNVGSQTMYCTDCHGPNTNTGTTVPTSPTPNGPHGSENPFILKGLWNDRTGGKDYSTQSHLCYKCHDINVYSKDANCENCTGFSKGQDKNLHKLHLGKDDALSPSGNKNIACMTCHSGVPHGWNGNPANQNYGTPNYGKMLLVERDDATPYRTDKTRLLIGTWANSGNWDFDNCRPAMEGKPRWVGDQNWQKCKG